MGTYKPLTNGQPKSCAAGQARQAVIHAVKAFKDMLALLLRNPRSIVNNPEEKIVLHSTYFHTDPRRFACIFDCVLDQVLQKLFHLCRIR